MTASNADEVPPYVCIYGPTGSGKSRLGILLAEACGGEIINADSVQFYRGFAIGAAKPDPADLIRVPHHLLDIVSAEDDFTAAEFARRGQACIAALHKRGKVPIVVGGSGLYLRCLWGENFHLLPSDEALRDELRTLSDEQLYRELAERDPVRAAELHPHDRLRLLRSVEICRLTKSSYTAMTAERHAATYPPRLRIFLNPERPVLDAQLRERTREMLKLGLLAEIDALLQSGCSPLAKPMQSIGYKQGLDFREGRIATHDELEEKIFRATRQYAKRQHTWFKNLSHDLVVSRVDNAAVAAILNALTARC